MSDLGYAKYHQTDDIEDLKTVLVHCPVVRMGKVYRGEAFKNGEVIPKGKCIGCSICAHKRPDKIWMSKEN